MKKRIAAFAVACIATLSACIPWYGGRTEKHDIGAWVRCANIAQNYRGEGWFHTEASGPACGGNGNTEQACWDVLALDARFTVYDRTIVCQVLYVWQWGSLGFVE